MNEIKMEWILQKIRRERARRQLLMSTVFEREIQYVWWRLVCFAVRRRSIISSVPVRQRLRRVLARAKHGTHRHRVGRALFRCLTAWLYCECARWTHLCRRRRTDTIAIEECPGLGNFPTKKQTHSRGSDIESIVPLSICAYVFARNSKHEETDIFGLYSICACVRHNWCPSVGWEKSVMHKNASNTNFENSLWMRVRRAISGEISDRDLSFAHHDCNHSICILDCGCWLHSAAALKMDSCSRAPLRSI